MDCDAIREKLHLLLLGELTGPERDAINALSQLLLSKEQALRAEHREKLLARLPPRSYQRLYGVERIQAALGELLLAARSPGVLALAGLGGIGKTAIADAVIRVLFDKLPFMDVIWLRVQSPVTNPSIVWERIWAQLAGYLLTNPTPVLEYPQALRKAFKEFPRLVVIDNLEDDLFHADWHFWLREFANPSKFLLTTRVLPNSMADVYVVKVSELKPEAAKDLLLDHAEKLGLKTSLSALRKNATNIYEHTGGNPLALKLVVGLLHVWPLPTILRALQQGPGSDVEGMYRGIYQHSWQTLSGNARQLLQAMPLAGEEGATIEQLGAISELQEIELREAVKELASRSLLEMRNSIGETRYGIHHLTQTFLHSQIVNQL